MRFGFPYYLSLLASLILSGIASGETKNTYDPAAFLQKQEFTESKMVDNAKVQHSYVMINGAKYRKLTTESGAILIPLFEEILREDLKHAKCTSDFQKGEIAPLTLAAIEPKIQDQIKSHTKQILALIDLKCSTTSTAVNKKEADNKIKAVKLESDSSISPITTNDGKTNVPPEEKEL